MWVRAINRPSGETLGQLCAAPSQSRVLSIHVHRREPDGGRNDRVRKGHDVVEALTRSGFITVTLAGRKSMVLA